jgi:hypothetical protein
MVKNKYLPSFLRNINDVDTWVITCRHQGGAGGGVVVHDLL